MKAVFLCAGAGKRMGALTDSRNKCMLPVANKPLIEWNLSNLYDLGIKDFTFVVGYQKEEILNYFKDGSDWKVNIEYLNQKELNGTGNALKTLENVIEDENFIALNGDILFNKSDFTQIINCKNSIGTYIVENPKPYGSIELKDKKIIRINEKSENPSSNLINSGIYHFDRDIFESLSKIKKSSRGEYELTDAINLLATEKEVNSITLKDWQEISYPWDLLDANKKILNELREHYSLNKEEFIVGKNTEILPGTFIESSVIIGDNCKIGPNCYIRGSTAIGDNCHVGNASEIKNSIIMNNTNIPHHNYIGDSIIGKNCNLGSGTKIANLKLNNKNVQFTYNDSKSLGGKKIDSGRRKLGAIIGDNVKTGVNANIMPGKNISSNSYIGAGVTVFQNLNKNQIISLVNPSSVVKNK